jgi:hypothetical protein
MYKVDEKHVASTLCRFFMNCIVSMRSSIPNFVFALTVSSFENALQLDIETKADTRPGL